MRNERFIKDGIKTFGLVTSSFPTGFYNHGIPQIVVSLKYTIDEKTFEGCATLFTKRIYFIGMTIPIRVNPENPMDCSIIVTK